MQTTTARDEPLSRSSTVADSIRASVRALYERYPYPHYPLLAKPRWQEGWLTGSLFSARLAAWRNGTSSDGSSRRILIAGCGEILPAVICAQEPRAHRIDAVDLSAGSLRRAMFRCASEITRLRLHQADATEWFARHQTTYDHIDCYGVLHHLADPITGLKHLAQALKPGGTARVMVYNAPARTWIHAWQHVFRGLTLNPATGEDLAAAVRLVRTAGEHSEPLAALLAQMGPSVLSNRTRFADTFLHPREARIGPAAWINAIADSGLLLNGIYDRYQECDDLENPLWGIEPGTMLDRVHTGALQNNLEFFLQRTGGRPAEKKSGGKFWAPVRAVATLMTSTPYGWWTSEETSPVPFGLRRHLWLLHRRHLADGSGLLTDSNARNLGTLALRRLARLGAILPGQLTDEYRQTAGAAMNPATPTGQRYASASEPAAVAAPVAAEIDRLCSAKGISPRRRQLILQRLVRAMNP
jgi:SAM-dependent methyltransferase